MGKKLSETDFMTEVEELLDKNFIGYAVLTIEGLDGVEEGIVFFQEGTVIGAIYEFTKYGVQTFAKDALPAVFNAAAAEHGIIDAYSLSKQQMELVGAFQDRMVLEKPLEKKAILKFKSKEYSDYYAKKFLGTKLKSEETRAEILKRFGLGKL